MLKVRQLNSLPHEHTDKHIITLSAAQCSVYTTMQLINNDAIIIMHKNTD